MGQMTNSWDSNASQQGEELGTVGDLEQELAMQESDQGQAVNRSDQGRHGSAQLDDQSFFAARVDVYMCHAPAQRAGVVDHLRAALLRQHVAPSVLWTTNDLMTPSGTSGSATTQCAVAIFILTPEFVTKPYLMAELHTLLHRARQPGDPVVLLPVLYTLKYSQATNLEERLYRERSLWDEGDRPDAATLQRWSQDVVDLLNITGIRSDQVPGDAALVERIAAATISHLKTAQRLRSRHPGPDVELPAYLVGMNHRRNEVIQRLEQHSVVLVHGMGGSGKTVLAKSVYKALQGRASFDNVCFVALVADVRDGDGQLKTISEQQKITAQCKMLKHMCDVRVPDVDSLDDGRAQLKRGLQSRRVLLVIDNLWGDALANLLPDQLMSGVLAVGSMVLLTSRETFSANSPLHLRGGLNAAACPALLLDGKEALELFCGHAGLTSSEIPPDKDVAVSFILEHCAGLPMALEVTAKTLAMFPAAWGGIKKEFQSILAQRDIRKDGEYASLHTVFEMSFRNLGEGDRNMLLDMVFLLTSGEKGWTLFDLAELHFNPGKMDGIGNWDMMRMYCGWHLEQLRMCGLVDKVVDDGGSMSTDPWPPELLPEPLFTPMLHDTLTGFLQHKLSAPGALRRVFTSVSPSAGPEDTGREEAWEIRECSNNFAAGRPSGIRGEHSTGEEEEQKAVKLLVEELDADDVRAFAYDAKSGQHQLVVSRPSASRRHWFLKLAGAVISSTQHEDFSSLHWLEVDGKTYNEPQPQGMTCISGFLPNLRLLYLGCLGDTSLRHLELPAVGYMALEHMPYLHTLPAYEYLSRLLKLDLVECGSLEILDVQHMTALTALSVEDCDSLTALQELPRLSKLKSLQISACPRLQLDSLSSLAGLEELWVAEWDRTVAIEGLEELTQLKKLRLEVADGQQGYEDDDSDNWTSVSSSSITSSQLHDALSEPSEEWVPPNLSHLTNLRWLWLHGFNCSLEETLVGMNSASLHEFWLQDCSTVQMLQLPGSCLHCLRLRSCSNLRAVCGLGAATSLEMLDVRGCSRLIALHGLGSLEQLRLLYTQHCLSIESLQGLGSLSTVVEVCVRVPSPTTPLPNIGGLTNLKSLSIIEYSKAEDAPGLEQLTGLVTLELYCTEAVQSFPDCSRLSKQLRLQVLVAPRHVADRHLLDEINQMRVVGCRTLKILEDVSGLSQLTSIQVKECPRLKQIVGLLALPCLEVVEVDGTAYNREAQGSRWLALAGGR